MREFVKRHRQLVAWLALSVGMVAILLYMAKDVQLEPTQRAALVASTIGVAGLCVWIIGWE